MRMKLTVLGILCWSFTLATWGVSSSLPTSNNPKISKNQSGSCSLQNDDLSKANQSEIAVLVWANEAAVSVYTYNFSNSITALRSLSSFFTEEEYMHFLKALAASENYKNVLRKKLIVSAVATRAPIILEKGVSQSVYSWKIKIPLLVTYQSPNESINYHYTITMKIVRVPTIKAPRGLAISQFVVKKSTR